MGTVGSIALSFIAHYWALGAVVAIVAWLIRNRYYNGLHEYPGPFLASLTDLWRLFEVWGRKSEVTHRQLHAKYGDVVRLGPSTISFADPKALKTIYGLNKGFIKVRQFFISLWNFSFPLKSSPLQGYMLTGRERP